MLFFPREDWDPKWIDPRVRLLWYDEKSTQFQFHGYLPIDQAGPQALTELFGGGKWKVQVTAKDEKGVEHVARSNVRTLPGVYRRPMGELPGIRPVNPAPAPVATGGRGDGALPTAGESLNAALVGSVIDLLKAQREGARLPVPSFDWGPVITGALALLTTILTKLMERKEGSDPVLLAQLQKLDAEIAALKEQPGPSTSAITDALEGIERIVSVSAKVRKLAGGEEPADPEAAMWGLGKMALETMMKGGQPGQPAALPPGATPVPAAPPPSSATPLWQRVLVRHGADMVVAARRGVDPGTAAEYTMQMLPADVLGVVIEFLQRPDAAGIIVQVVPDLGSFPSWVEKFVAEARAQVVGEEEEEDAEEGGDSPATE